MRKLDYTAMVASSVGQLGNCCHPMSLSFPSRKNSTLVGQGHALPGASVAACQELSTD
jgi:hypothetical protein